ncbi:N-(5'-phosphoribosyl)anthranilate isomerase [Nioella sp.]|uniref:N-(5'-phosphoribosyl)anthranilate isomerase n=1 Tax=Nioella sp. TaxID=1912091 RepID=UPI003A872459
MAELPRYLTPDLWLDQIFSSKEAQRGGIVKRQIRDVERLVGRQAFARALEQKGFQAVENGRHFVVFCNGAPIRRVR